MLHVGDGNVTNARDVVFAIPRTRLCTSTVTQQAYHAQTFQHHLTIYIYISNDLEASRAGPYISVKTSAYTTYLPLARSTVRAYKGTTQRLNQPCQMLFDVLSCPHC